MTDGVEKAEEPEQAALDEARIQKIAERFVEGSDHIEDLPKEARLTRDLLWLYLAHADENWDTDPPDDEVKRLLVRSIFRLEAKILRIEKALRKAGLLSMED